MTAPTLLLVVHWLAGFVVLAAGLHRLEHLNVLRKGLTRQARVMLWIEALAWSGLCVGAAGAIITPLLPLERPTLQDSCVMAGLAWLAMRRQLVSEKCQP